jgi:hypothetical protein
MNEAYLTMLESAVIALVTGRKHNERIHVNDALTRPPLNFLTTPEALVMRISKERAGRWVHRTFAFKCQSCGKVSGMEECDHFPKFDCPACGGDVEEIPA